MSKVLSQDEVNALLNGISGQKVDEGKEEVPQGGVSAYDLTTHDRIIRGRMPTLEIINERFSRFFSVSMASALRKEVDITTGNIEVMKFGDFMRTIPMPSSINIFSMQPLRGYAVTVVNSKTVFMLIDHFFGGSGQTHVKAEGRSFTPIENRIINKVMVDLLQDLQKAWRPVYELEIKLQRSEINPQFAAIVAPTEVCISISFKLEIDGEGSDLMLCFPYSTIEVIKDKLYAGFQSDRLDMDNSWIERLKKEVSKVMVDVDVEFGATEILLEDFMKLEVGDVLLLDKWANEPMEVLVDKVCKFEGFPGLYRGAQAVKISGLSDLDN